APTIQRSGPPSPCIVGAGEDVGMGPLWLPVCAHPRISSPYLKCIGHKGPPLREAVPRRLPGTKSVRDYTAPAKSSSTYQYSKLLWMICLSSSAPTSRGQLTSSRCCLSVPSISAPASASPKPSAARPFG